jgi:hypothetical protein
MITKSELQAVYREVKAEDRRQREEPPTVDEMLAYVQGELSPEDEARVGQRLVLYPALIRALTTPFPAEDAVPGDPGYLSSAALDERWASMQTRLHGDQPGSELFPPPQARVLRFWQRSAAALAAVLVLAVSGLLLQAQAVKRLQVEQREPHVMGDQWLRPDGTRGGPVAPLSMEGDSFLLRGVLPREFYPQYRFEIVAKDARPIWTATVGPIKDEFSLIVPHAFLAPGEYQVVLYGLRGSREERLSSFTFHVEGR